MSGIDRFGASSSAHTIEDQPQETHTPADTSRPHTPEQSAGPSGASHSEVAEFLEHQRPGSPESSASEYSESSASDYGDPGNFRPLTSPSSQRNSQEIPPMPNPFSPRNSGDFGQLTNSPSPRNSQEIPPMPNPHELGLNRDLMAFSGNAALRRRATRPRLDDQPIARSTQQFRAANHPALSADDRSEMQRLASQGEQFVSRARQNRQATTKAAASSSQPSTERFGMSDAEYSQRFAPDQQTPSASSSQPKEKEERFGMSDAEYNRRFAKD
jgi:hypothetical protein